MKLPKRITAAMAGIAMTFGAVTGTMADDTAPQTDTTISTPTGFDTGRILSNDNADDLLTARLLPVATGANIVVMRNMLGQTRTVTTGQTFLLRNNENGHWATITADAKGVMTLTQQGYSSQSWLGGYNALLVADTAANDVCTMTDDFKKANMMVFQGVTVTGSLLQIWTPERQSSKPVADTWYTAEAVTDGDKAECKRSVGKKFQVAIPDYLKKHAHTPT